MHEKYCQWWKSQYYSSGTTSAETSATLPRAHISDADTQLKEIILVINSKMTTMITRNCLVNRKQSKFHGSSLVLKLFATFSPSKTTTWFPWKLSFDFSKETLSRPCLIIVHLFVKVCTCMWLHACENTPKNKLLAVLLHVWLHICAGLSHNFPVISCRTACRLGLLWIS